MSPADLRLALLQASSHVVRQQFHGKHEQDRADAVTWRSRWAAVLEELRDDAAAQGHK